MKLNTQMKHTTAPAGANRTLKDIKAITMRGRRYKFKVARLKTVRGLTDHPLTPGKTVTIDSREVGEQLLATMLDELIHTLKWEISNEEVDEMSDDMARVLWRAGLRFTEEEIEEQRPLVI